MLQPAPLQTSYARYHLPAFNGMLADEINFTADTRIVETAGGIHFGRAVSQGDNEQGCKLGGTHFVGITRADPTVAIAGTLTTDMYPQYDNAGVLVMGDIWVNCPSDITFGGAVSYDATTGELGDSGTAIAGSRWMTSAIAVGNDATGHPAYLAVARLGNISGNVT